MKITIDKNKCIGCGTCTALCPRAFEMGEDGKAVVKKLTNEEINDIKDCIREAIDNCPTQAISTKD